MKWLAPQSNVSNTAMLQYLAGKVVPWPSFSHEFFIIYSTVVVSEHYCRLLKRSPYKLNHLVMHKMSLIQTHHNLFPPICCARYYAKNSAEGIISISVL